MSTKTCNVSEMVQGYYDGLVGSHIHTLDWYHNQRTWMTLNGEEIKVFWRVLEFE